MLVAGLAAVFAGRAVAEERVLLDGVVAHVNAHIITLGDVLMAMDLKVNELKKIPRRDDANRRYRESFDRALDMLIERYVVLDAYEKGEGRIPDWAVNARAKELLDERFGGDRSELIRVLSEQGMTYAEWLKQVEQQVILLSMRNSSVDQHVSVSPDDVRSRYEARREAYAEPETVNVRILSLPAPSEQQEAVRKQMEALRLRIINGADFAEVARVESKGFAAEAGGDQGWCEPGTLLPEVAAAIATMKPGDVSAVLVANNYCFLCKLEGRRPPRIRPFTEVQKAIELELKQERSRTLHQEWVQRLRRDTYVRIFEQDAD